MRARVPLLVLIYVTLDFANPLMPGAVSFNAGSMDVVQGDRTTRAVKTLTAPVSLVASGLPWSVVVSTVPLGPPATLSTAGSPAALRPACRSSLPRCPASPLSSEDH